MPKQKLVTPRRKVPETTVQEYANYFDEDLSGSFTSGPVYDHEEMAKKVQENTASFETLKPRVYEKLPKSGESSSGSLSASVSRPDDDEEMAKKVQENTASFETLKLGVHKNPPVSKESSSSASVSRYVWEDEEMTNKIQANIASFEKLKAGAYKKLKKPPNSDESSSKE
jgi:hypothetical protein